MKKITSRLKRATTLLTLTALVAACGGGSESADTTERTRNSALWAASTVPSKSIVYGTQDGFVQVIDINPASASVSPWTFAEVTPNALLPNAVVSVAVDTSSSEVIYAGVDKAGSAYINRVDYDGNSTEVFNAPNSFVLGMGYDSGSRTAVMRFNDSGVGKYILHEVDSFNSPIFSSSISYYMAPAFDGKRFVVARGDGLRDLDVTNFKVVNQSTDTVSSPADLWSFAADTQSSFYYGARQQGGEILVMDMTKTNPLTKVGSVTNPASLAVFTDGMIVAGTGQDPTKTAGVIGAITLIDPTGTASPVTFKGVGTGAASSGVQSVWAVESPIATGAPRVTLDSSGTLTCLDGTWRSDVPLSRLSRAPMASVREYTWFKSGAEIADAESETFIPTEEGKYSCAVTALNLAGLGRSDMAREVVVSESELASSSSTTVPSSDAVTTVPSGDTASSVPSTSVESPGSAESAPTESPVATIPTMTPGTPVAVVTPSLRSARWTFKGRTVRVTFRKYAGAKRYRLSVAGATRKNVVCKSSKTTVTCTTTGLKKGINTFSARALSTSGVTVALSTKTRLTK